MKTNSNIIIHFTDSLTSGYPGPEDDFIDGNWINRVSHENLDVSYKVILWILCIILKAFERMICLNEKDGSILNDRRYKSGYIK